MRIIVHRRRVYTGVPGSNNYYGISSNSIGGVSCGALGLQFATISENSC